MTASPAALASIAATGLPLPAQACLASLAESEGGDVANRLYSGGELIAEDPRVGTDDRGRLWLGDLSTFPDWRGATTGGGRLISTAAGWLQFTHTTWVRVAARTGKSDFTVDYWANGWWLAQDDFRRRSGRDLLAALTAGQLSLIHPYLGLTPNNTWPGGADAGFPKRYARNLAALQAPPPEPEPAPAPPPQPAAVTLLLPPSLMAVDATGAAVPITLRIDAPSTPPSSSIMRIPALACVAALACGLAGSVPATPVKEARAEASVPLPAAVAIPAKSYAGPAWRFGQSAAGKLTVECRLSGGSWATCP